METYTDESQVTLTGRAVAVVDAVGGAPRIITSPDVAAWQPDWAPSERIAFVVQDSVDAPPTAARVMTMAPDGSDVRDASAPDLPFAFDPVWMPDGVTLSMTTADDERGPQWLAFLDAAGQVTEADWSIDGIRGLQHRARRLLGGPPGDGRVRVPTTLTSSPTGSLRIPRFGHTATLLADGRVLIVGNSSQYGTAAEVFSLTPAATPGAHPLERESPESP